MAATVLGKRTRSTAASSESHDSSRTTRSQQRTKQFVILDDSENVNPFVTRPLRSGAKDGDAMEVDGLDASPPTKRSRITRSTFPAKHGVAESRVAPSPAKITSHFKTTKAAAAAPIEKKPVEFAVPRTPRHRDAAAKVAVTPKHRVLVPGKSLTPRTPRTPSTPRAAALTVYNEARQLFTKGNAPSSLYGREKERAHLEEFVQSRLDSRSSGCIYVSGPPGTGKSAFVNDITAKIAEARTVSVSYINCMSVRNAEDMHLKLLEDFLGDLTETSFSSKPTAALKKLFYACQASYLVTLDEIDYLLDLDIDLLYSIFEWALDPKSSLVLVGIANALDFTDRFLPRLKSRGLKPDLLPFLPYTAPQLATIITSKLKSLLPESAADKNYVPFLHPTAIQFLSKKVSSQSGDLRKSFDICRRAVDLIETETRDLAAKRASEATTSPPLSPCKTPGVGILVENMNLSSSPVARSPAKTPRKLVDPGKKAADAASLASLTIETAPRATIAHVARITATIFSNGTTQRLQNLNLQQKAVLCSLTALENKKRELATDPYFNNPFAPALARKDSSSAPTIKELYEAYSNSCKRENLLHPLTSSEFRDVVGSLETLGMVSPVEGKAGSLVMGGAAALTPSKRGRGGFGISIEDRKVASSVSKKELEQAIDSMKVGKSVLFGLLHGDAL